MTDGWIAVLFYVVGVPVAGAIGWWLDWWLDRRWERRR